MSAGLLKPLVKELTNVEDPLTCLSALSLLKEQVEQASSSSLQALLASFFLPHLEQLLSHAGSMLKPTAMQASCASSGCITMLLNCFCMIQFRLAGT